MADLRKRLFFRCSRCDARCGVLNAPRVGSPLHCRKCHRLAYESTQRWNTFLRTGRFTGRFGRLVIAMAEGEDLDRAFKGR